MRKANLTRAYGCAQRLCCGTCSRLSGVASRYLEAPASVAVGDYINWDRNSKMWFRVAAIDWHRRMVKVQESTEVRALGAGPLRLRFVGDDDADLLGERKGSEGAEGSNQSRRSTVARPPRWIHMARLAGALVRRSKLSGRGQPIVYKLPRPSSEWGMRKLREWSREDKARMEEEAARAEEQAAVRELEAQAERRLAARHRRVAVCRRLLWKLDDSRSDAFQEWLRVGAALYMVSPSPPLGYDLLVAVLQERDTVRSSWLHGVTWCWPYLDAVAARCAWCASSPVSCPKTRSSRMWLPQRCFQTGLSGPLGSPLGGKN